MKAYKKSTSFWSANFYFYFKNIESLGRVRIQRIGKLTTQNEKMAQCSVTVTTSISGLSVSPTSKTLNVGEKLDLSNSVTKTPSTAREGITWTSSNSSIASVSQTGVITANSTGTATITVKSSSGNRFATCTITVVDGYIVGLGRSSNSGYLTKYDSNGNVTWSKFTSNGQVNTIVQISDGSYIVGEGLSSSSGHLVKYDKNGNKIWQKDTTNGQISVIIQASDGNYIAGEGFSSNDGHLVKYDKNGNVIWDKQTSMGSINAILEIKY